MKKLILVFFLWLAAFMFIDDSGKGVRPEKCKAEVSFIKGDDRMNVTVVQSLRHGVGVLSISGVLYKNDKTAGYISKTINFSYKKEGVDYLVTSRIISNSPQMNLDNDLEREWLPDFFYKTDKSIVWTILPISHSSSLVFSETVPLFMCNIIR